MRTPLRLLSNGMILFATLGLTGMAHAEISFGSFGSSSSEHSLVTSSGHPESTKISRSSIKVMGPGRLVQAAERRPEKACGDAK
ncbi:hypothetical protein [Pseudomonas sp. GD03944]|uniref:hypothetical protein n=1 Tax=Pseudomonas sp. GD03944 TaxID=2975409 RepID=UPI00244C7556|nr:hypothetical protein [Pseudomonas sp. GD03944]MDH1262369.1 hypothetical protein [Pseudomonas sp. GD03944]